MNTKKKPRTASPKQLSPEQDKKLKYVQMVAAVRAWLAVEHPNNSNLGSDRIDICLYDDVGGGETLACFHANADDAYVLGDLMAMPDD